MRLSKKLTSLSDLLNPLLVKETNQLLRSKAFHIVVILSAIISCFIVLFGIVDFSNSTQKLVGKYTFYMIYSLLWAIVIVIFPLIGGIRFYNERRSGEFELFQITGIKTSSIVRGKAQANLIISLVIIISVIPFLVLCNFLRGISIIEILFFLGLLIFLTLVSSRISIFIASLRFPLIIMVIAALVYIGSLISFSIGFSVFMIEEFHFEKLFNPRSEIFLFMAMIIIGSLFYYPILTLTARDSIKSINELRTTGFRLYFILLLMVITVIAIVLGLTAFTPGSLSSSRIRESLQIGYILLFFSPIICIQFSLLSSHNPCAKASQVHFKKGLLKVFRFLFYPGQGSYRIWFSIVLALLFCYEDFIMNWTLKSPWNSSIEIQYYPLTTMTVIMSFNSFIGAGLFQLFFKAKIKSNKIYSYVGIFFNLLIIFICLLMLAADNEEAKFQIPFYYLDPNAFEKTTMNAQIIVPIFIIANAIYGYFLYLYQLKTESKNKKLPE